MASWVCNIADQLHYHIYNQLYQLSGSNWPNSNKYLLVWLDSRHNYYGIIFSLNSKLAKLIYDTTISMSFYTNFLIRVFIECWAFDMLSTATKNHGSLLNQSEYYKKKANNVFIEILAHRVLYTIPSWTRNSSLYLYVAVIVDTHTK